MEKYNRIVKAIEDKQEKAVKKIIELYGKRGKLIQERDKPCVLQNEWEENMRCIADLSKKIEKSELFLPAYCDVLECLKNLAESLSPQKPSAEDAESEIEKLMESKKVKICLAKDELRSLSKAKRHRSITHADYVSVSKQEVKLQKEVCELESQVFQIGIFKCIIRNIIKLPEDQM